MNLLFQHVQLDYHPETLSSTLVAEASPAFPALAEISLFNLPSEQLSLVYSAMQCIRNVSFVSENTFVLTQSADFMVLLAKAMSLPPSFLYLELRHFAFDIFDNLSYVYILRNPLDFYLGCVKHAIHGQDRHLILASVRSLSRLAVMEQNHKVIGALEPPFLQRLLDLTMTQDEEVILIILEFLYQFTSISAEVGRRLVTSAKFNGKAGMGAAKVLMAGFLSHPPSCLLHPSAP
jgi:hypothetical protein